MNEKPDTTTTPSPARGIMSEEPASNLSISMLFLWLALGTVLIICVLAYRWNDVPHFGPPPPTYKENEALITLALLGALGGYLHGIQSFALYVGNRDLRNSWILYYLFAPIKGAALAVIVALVLRVTVVSSTGNEDLKNINWLGLYAMAALSGMFANQAIEKLADIFNNVLKQVVAANPRSAAHSDQKQTKP
jgi:hypothetical protein